jgi:hypothetical protein
VRSAGVEPATSRLSTWPLCQFGVRARGAFGPARTGCLFLTGEALCQVSYEGVAGDPGLEPRPADSESAVLPDYTSLHRYGRRESNAHATRFGLARSASCLTPAWCAARGSNSVPWGKGPVHHPSCLRRLERHAGVEPAFPVWRTGTLTVVLMPPSGSPRTRTSRLLIFTQPLYLMS